MNVKDIIIILAVFLISNTSFAQWYSNNSIWYFNKQEQLGFQAHGYLKYTVEKDTVINLINSKMILVNGELYNGTTLTTDTIFVYENSNKIYYWDNTTYKLMYDFNLNIGDTLNTEIINNCDSVSPLIIDSIKTLNVSGVDLQKQFISFTAYNGNDSNIFNYEILEYVGYEQNFIFSPSCINGESFVYSGLRCFSNEAFDYKNPWWEEHYGNFTCDELVNETKLEEDRFSNFIKIYPNPSSGNVQLIIGNEQLGSTVQIININGELVKQFKIQNPEFNIDLSSEAKAVYFVKLIGESGVSTQKIVLE